EGGANGGSDARWAVRPPRNPRRSTSAGFAFVTGCSVPAHDPRMIECGAICCTAYVRFSNRPVRVKRFQTIHRHGVDVAHGLALLFGLGTQALVWGFLSQAG